MTDADPRANGYPPRAESAPPDTSVSVDSSPGGASAYPSMRVPEFHQTAETGEPGYDSPAQPGSGGAGAWPAWPGVARPAGWFLSVPREAAPLGTADMEPARPDNQAPGSQAPGNGMIAPPAYPAPAQAWLPQAPAEEEPPWPDGDQPDDEWPEYDQLADDDAQDWTTRPDYPQAAAWSETVVGPTEALRGRAGGPGFRVPAGSGYGLQDPANRSGWQIADGLWRESGISWDSADDTLADEDPLPARPRDAHSLPGRAFPLGAPTVADAPTRPEAVTPEAFTRPEALTRPEAVTPEAFIPEAFTRPEAFTPEVVTPEADAPETGAPQAAAPEAVVLEVTPPPAAPAIPAPSPLGAGDLPRRRARPLHPEAPLPPRDTLPYAGAQPPEAPRSRPAETREWRLRYDRQAGLDEQARNGRQAWDDQQPDEGYGQPRPRLGYQGYQARQDYLAQQGYRDLQDQSPDPSPADEWQPSQRRPRQRQDWEDPLPWEDQAVPAFPARRPARGRKAWQVARVTVPVGVILAVGAGALVMLTGKTHEVLARTGSQSPASQGAPATTPAGNGGSVGLAPTATAQPAPLAFPGYPGRQGSESVNSIASADAVQVAVGSADGRAAIWRRDNGGAWSLVTGATAVTQEPSGTVLTSVTHGQAGWLAVGDVAPVSFGKSGTARAPVVLTSADGRGWQAATGSAAFSAPGFQVNAAASNGSGYVVVGSQLHHGKPVDAMWWSPDLTNWVRGGDTMMTTMSGTSSGMTDSAIFAVAATPAGFIAVGTHDDCHTAWVTADGQHWQSYDIPKPTGTQLPLLNHVAVMGKLVVATGDIGASGGRFPLAVTSTDGGAHWRTTSLGGPGDFSGPKGTVTALAAEGTGFLAAGLVGKQAVTWTSSDGISWSAAMPASGGTQQITVLAAEGNKVTRIAVLTAANGNRSVAITTPAR
jgi:hypothetical protein